MCISIKQATPCRKLAHAIGSKAATDIFTVAEELATNKLMPRRPHPKAPTSTPTP